MEIQQLTDQNLDEWQDYVISKQKTTFYHSIKWKRIIEKHYGFNSYFLIAKEDNKVRGILPLFLSKSIFLGKSLIPVPFSTFGSVCADNEEIEKALIEKAKEIAKKENVNHLEFRLFEKIGDLPANAENYEFLLDINGSLDSLWNKSFKKEVRNSIMKAIKSNIRVEFDNKYLKEFYDVYACNMRDIGGLVHSFSFFEDLFKTFETRLVVAFYGDKLIGGLIFFLFKNKAYNLFVSSLRKYFKFVPNYLLYWESIKYCYKNNYDVFSLGRSQLDSGTYKFKKQWVAIPRQIYHQYYLNKGIGIPTIASSKSKLSLAIEIYKKTPVFITKIIGPILVKHITL